MKVLYATSMIYPSPLANRLQVLSMAKEFHRLLGNQFYLGGSDVTYNEDNEEENLPIHNFGRLRSVILAFKYVLFIRKHDIDCIYSREEKLLFLIDLYSVLLLQRRLCLVYEAHFVPERSHIIFRWVYSRSSCMVVLTSFIQKKLTKMGVPSENIIVAPDGVTLSLFDISVVKEDARREIGLPQDKKIVLYTGSFDRYVSWKGIDVLIDSAKHLDNDVLVVLVGGRSDELARLREEYTEENLMFIERQEHGRIPYYLKAADVLVLPNKTGTLASEEYTSPMKLFEYMASGTPIVASDLPSVREVLSPESCLFVRPNTPSALAEGVTVLMKDTVRGKHLAATAKKEAHKYTWAKRTGAIMQKVSEMCR